MEEMPNVNRAGAGASGEKGGTELHGSYKIRYPLLCDGYHFYVYGHPQNFKQFNFHV